MKTNNLKLNATFVNDMIFLISIGVLGMAFLKILTPFIPILLIAIIIVIFYQSVYKFILGKLKNNAVSAALTSLLVIISIVIPIMVLFTLAAQEVNGIMEEVLKVFTGSGQLDQKTAIQIKTLVTKSLEQLGIINQNQISGAINIDIKHFLSNYNVLNKIISLVPTLLSTISSFADFALKLFILLFLTFFMFIEYENIPKYIAKYSPLDDSLDYLLFKKFVTTVKAIVKGNFVVAMMHATSITLPLILFHVPGIATWWILMFFLSIVPVGAGAISVPIGIFMIYSPDYTLLQGVFFILYSIVSINIVESIVRPQLTKDGTGLHPILILLSSIGGLIAFSNPLGLLYGQLIAVFYKTVISVYQDKYNQTNG